MLALCKGLQLKFSDVKNIDTDTLFTWVKYRDDDQATESDKKPYLILDVREDEEFKISHIKESILINPSATDDQIGSVLKENIKNISLKEPATQGEPINVICYCSLGYRASTLARKIQNLESTIGVPLNIYNLEGCIFKWANEGKPLIDGKGEPTKFVHPYNFMFGSLLDSDRRKYKADE